MKAKLLTIAIVAISLVALLTISCAPAAEGPERIDLDFNSADPGGSWYPTAIALAAIWETNVPGVAFTHIPGGGVSNAKAIAEDTTDIAISTGISVGDAIMGNEPFEKKYDTIRAMAAFLAETYNLVTFADSGINTLEDLKGKRICAAKKGWTAEVMTSRQLAAVGLTYDDMAKVEFVTPSEGVKLMQDGHVDATVVGFDVHGDPQLTEITVFKPIRIIPLTDAILADLQKINPAMAKTIVPAGSYKGVDTDVIGVQAGSGLIINPNVPEDIAYQLTRAMAENWVSHMHPVLAELAEHQPQDLANPLLGAPHHPGVARYYKEVGWIQ